ncbi:MAG: hypothetical protein PHP96_02755 [Candidatus Dojkabacteria bacterium]|jgi:hypothetical protein|nr:hypothetical protein [Candidatus Dojkabacteria bacterium]
MVKDKEKNDFEKILEVITGEKALKEKQREMKKMKKQAIEDQKNKKRKEIIEKSVKLEEDPVQNRKVVQNIKLFQWNAPDRYQINFTNKRFLIIVSLALLFSLLLVILGHYFLMAAIMSLLFLLYVAGTTRPLTVEHYVTARGIDTGGKLYEWYMLDSFFFSKKEDRYMLVVNTKLNYPKTLILLLGEDDKDPLFVLLQERLLYEEIKKWGRLDRLSYGEYISLEEV